MKKLAAGATVIGASGIASAESIEADEIGISEKIEKLIKNGKIEKAKELLEKHNIKYDHKKATKIVDGGSEIGTQSLFGKDRSDFNFFGWQLDGPLYNVMLKWDLDPHFSADCSQPNDVGAVTYSSARWEVADDSGMYDFYTENFYSKPSGYYGTWDDQVAHLYGDDTAGYIGHTIEKAEAYRGNKQNVWAHYQHTWTPPWKLGCFGAQLGKSVSITAGVLSVSTVADTWEINLNPIEL